jgi:hypothetical protein
MRIGLLTDLTIELQTELINRGVKEASRELAKDIPARKSIGRPN